VRSSTLRLAALAALALAAPAMAAGCASERAREVPPELIRLYERGDYFTLRERLSEPSAEEPAGLTVLRAAVVNAFNDPERSNAILDPVIDGGPSVPDSLRFEARRIRLRNLVRMHRYPEAARTVERLLRAPPARLDSAELADLRNTRRLTEALADVPPQRIVARAASELPRIGRGHVPVTVGDSLRDYAIDTGANFSVLIRSEAEALGLAIREAGLEVGTSTDLRIHADLAVADRVALGGLELENVVFLVVPDAMFTFGDFVIRGLVGFPVLEAAGELRFPLVRVRWEGEELVCGLDTGANRTAFYERFYRDRRARIDSAGIPDTARVGGAGGVREIPVRRLEDVTLAIGRESVTLPTVDVYLRDLRRGPGEDARDCNVGQDVLRRFGGYALNFRSMSFVLR